jgi:N-dimethylarginine dimethylaminohydrolase
MKSDRSVLMCPPTYFDIEYSINPWMDPENRVDRQLARDQWENVYYTLINLGVEVNIIDPEPGLPDMTFTGDCGLAIGDTFLASNFRHPERQGETDAYIRWFAHRGYNIIRMPETTYFEGLGDVILYEDDIIFGYGLRSSKMALAIIEETFPKLNVLAELQLADEGYYHAGLAISLIRKETILYYPDAFNHDSQRLIKDRFNNAIAVRIEDAESHFVCNNLVIDDNILLAGCSSELEDILNGLGIQVIRLEMSEFKKSGASLRCLVFDIY